MSQTPTTESRVMSSIEFARVTHREAGARIVMLTERVTFQPSGIEAGGYKKKFAPDFHTVGAGVRVLLIPSKGRTDGLAYASINDREMFGSLSPSEFEELPAAEQRGRVSQVSAGRLVLVDGKWAHDAR
jgi:hypothetical protein